MHGGRSPGRLIFADSASREAGQPGSQSRDARAAGQRGWGPAAGGPRVPPCLHPWVGSPARQAALPAACLAGPHLETQAKRIPVWKGRGAQRSDAESFSVLLPRSRPADQGRQDSSGMGAEGSSGVIVTPAATPTLPLPASGPLKTSLHLSKPISASVPGTAAPRDPPSGPSASSQYPASGRPPAPSRCTIPLSPPFPLQQTPSSPGSRCP